MSALCEATGLSRGGLYGHFLSTDEIFIALLELEKDDWQAERVFLDARYDFAVNMMKAFLQYGQQRGEFKPFNPQTEAEHIVIFLDGLRTASAVIFFSDEAISRQLNRILEKIKMEER